MIQLRPYQLEDKEIIRVRKKLLVLHQMGTGKSVIASRAVYEPGVFDGTPCLISCPSHVVSDWEDHLRSEYPGVRIQVCSELSPDEKRDALASKADFYILNVAMLAVKPTDKKTLAKQAKSGREHNYYKMPKVKSYIADEAHAGGYGRHARSWVGARMLADKCELVIPMTGTPIRTTSDGVWAQLRLVDKTLTSYWRFVKEHCILTETPWSVQVVGSRPSLHGEIAKRAIKRTYQEVGLAIPEVIPYFHKVRLSDPVRINYDRLKKDLRDEFGNPVFSAGAALSKLRIMVARDPNMLAKLEGIVADLDSFIIFVHHKEVAALVAQATGATIISGDIPGRLRSGFAKSSDKIVATISSLAASVDLSHHRDIVWYEEMYEPGTMKNALARVERWRKTGNNDEPVRSRYVYSPGTITERIHNLASGRQKDAENATNIERQLIQEELTLG